MYLYVLILRWSIKYIYIYILFYILGPIFGVDFSIEETSPPMEQLIQPKVYEDIEIIDDMEDVHAIAVRYI